uniref:Uncharacterized protein n=1 Tax=Arundo donax TaxID=35708 RepID=A0A0A9B2P6_ARUDO
MGAETGALAHDWLQRRRRHCARPAHAARAQGRGAQPRLAASSLCDGTREVVSDMEAPRCPDPLASRKIWWIHRCCRPDPPFSAGDWWCGELAR